MPSRNPCTRHLVSVPATGHLRPRRGRAGSTRTDVANHDTTPVIGQQPRTVLRNGFSNVLSLDAQPKDCRNTDHVRADARANRIPRQTSFFGLGGHGSPMAVAAWTLALTEDWFLPLIMRATVTAQVGSDEISQRWSSFHLPQSA